LRLLVVAGRPRHEAPSILFTQVLDGIN